MANGPRFPQQPGVYVPEAQRFQPRPPAPFGNEMPPAGPGCPPGANDIAEAKLCSSGYAVLFPYTCKLVGFSCELLSTETDVDYWIFLFDGDVSKYIQSNTAIPSSMIKVTPKPVNVGKERSFGSKTKWTPFDSAVSVGLSTTDEVFTIAGVNFWAYYHVVTGR